MSGASQGLRASLVSLGLWQAAAVKAVHALAQRLRLAGAPAAEEALLILGEPDALLTNTAFDVYQTAHDPVHPDHDRDFRGNASLPTQEFQHVVLCFLRISYDGEAVAERMIGAKVPRESVDDQRTPLALTVFDLTESGGVFRK